MLRDVKIGQYLSWSSVCQDGYSFSNTPVPGFDDGEVLARINEFQPLISTDGSYQNEILKSVFNIGLRKAEVKPLWIVPKSIRRRRFMHVARGGDVGTDAGMAPVDYTLHRQFAGLAKKGNDDKLKFANKYGLLSHQAVHNLIFRNPNTSRQFQIGESLVWWQEEINDMHSCVKLWDMIVSKDKKLKDVVLWHRDGIVIRLENGDIHLVRRSNLNLLARWNKGDTKGPALYYLSVESNKRLTNKLTPRIPEFEKQEAYIYPDTLLSAIWLMFLLEMGGNIRLVKCHICGSYFSSHDPRAQYCSARCRMRKYRKSTMKKSRKRSRVNGLR